MVLEVLQQATTALTAREIGIVLNLEPYTASQSVQYPLAALVRSGQINKIRTNSYNKYEYNNIPGTPI